MDQHTLNRKNKSLVVVITGGSGGLGRFLTDRFLSGNHIVNAVDIAEREATAVKRLAFYRSDVSSEEEVRSLFRDICHRHGRIDILINNAGKRYFSSLENASLRDISETVRINLTACYITAKEALAHMKRNGFGRIINISSNSSFRGIAEGSVYCATKAALNVFTESVAREMGRGDDITVNAICPDRIDLREWVRGDHSDYYCGEIKPDAVFRAICKVINGRMNGEIIPVISLRTYLAHCLHGVKKAMKQGRFLCGGALHD